MFLISEKNIKSPEKTISSIKLFSPNKIEIKDGKSIIIDLKVKIDKNKIQDFIKKDKDFLNKYRIEITMNPKMASYLIMSTGSQYFDLDYEDNLFLTLHNPSQMYDKVEIEKDKNICNVSIVRHYTNEFD